MTSTLFILAAVAGVGGLVIRYTNRDSRKLDKYDENPAVKAPVAELVGPLRAAGSSESTPGAGFNVNQFYRYPMNRVAAIFAGLSGVKAALPQLEQAGFDLTGVNVLSGREGARLLDLDGTGHGLLARALRVLQRGGAFEGETLRIHHSALGSDQSVVFVPVRNDRDEQQAAESCADAGAAPYSGSIAGPFTRYPESNNISSAIGADATMSITNIGCTPRPIRTSCLRAWGWVCRWVIPAAASMDTVHDQEGPSRFAFGRRLQPYSAPRLRHL